MKKPKEVNKLKQQAYFAPDGYIQVRSIANTKEISREMLCLREYGTPINTDIILSDYVRKITWEDYEKAGYYIKKVIVTIKFIK